MPFQKTDLFKKGLCLSCYKKCRCKNR